MQDPIILISTGNSGSSILMKMLSECGLFIGETKQYVERNHYEHPYFQSINKKLLGAERYPYSWLKQGRGFISNYCQDKRFIDEVRSESFHKMVMEGSVYDAIWGFKDPRTCITFPFWISVFPKCKCIFLDRHPDAKTGWNKAGNEGYDYFRSWFLENIILAFSSSIEIYSTFYDTIESSFEDLTEWLGLSFNEKVLSSWKPIIKENVL